MEVYLDNSATTKPIDEAIDELNKVLREDFGNPSSLHKKGMDAEKYIKEAKNLIGKTIKSKSPQSEIIFTSGGTEGNNLSIKGAFNSYKRRGNHIITTPFEHPSVKNPIKYLSENGCSVSYLPVKKNGLINEDALFDMMTDDTILISIMHVNNEIGTMQDIERIGALINEKYESDKEKKPVFHVDGVQSYLKCEFYPGSAGVDLYSASAHKFHGVKGTGFLYINKGTRLIPEILGGGQENDIRSGTENVPGIAAMKKAAEVSFSGLKKNNEKMCGLRDLFIKEVRDISDIRVNGAAGDENTDEKYKAPHIVSLTVDGIRSEVLLHSLEEKNIFISAGSACSSHKRVISDTLSAIGLNREEAESTVRFSLSRFTTEEEICYTLSVMNDIIPKLRRFKRR